MRIERELSFDDVLLLPQYSTIRSRSEVDLFSDLGKDLQLRLPIIASPMDTISEVDMAKTMSEFGGMAIIHRFCSIADQIQIINVSPAPKAAAIGVTDDYLERAQELVKFGCKVLCVDIAHGHHILMQEALARLKKNIPSNIHIMAGNVATYEGYKALSDWGADSVRVGIGSGSICSTRINTGHGRPLFETLRDIRGFGHITKTKVIADGGLRNAGDIVKALAIGANAVMTGALLAGTTETPGETMVQNGMLVKTYQGMSSRNSQQKWRKKSNAPEGITTTVPFRGSVKPILEELIALIKSGLSYSGARSLYELRDKKQFIEQTSAGQHESSTHILTKIW